MAREPPPCSEGLTRIKTPTCRPSWTKRGKILDTASFDANTKGYTVLLCWLEGFGIW